MLVGACFSGSSRMRLSRVTCCLTQFGQAGWKGVGVGVFTCVCCALETGSCLVLLGKAYKPWPRNEMRGS